MLWRVRTTLPDRPGTLAALAQRCGEAEVNIMAMQIFPGADAVTDQFVLRTPESFGVEEITALLESAGGGGVVVQPATEAALHDQPTLYVEASRRILEHPMSFPEVVAELFDAEADPTAGEATVQDVMALTVGDVDVQIHRTAPFTDTERARGAAVAGLINDVLRRTRESAVIASPTPVRGVASVPEYSVDGDTVTALLEGVAVGFATVHAPTGEDETCAVTLRVEPSWQRRGIGTRLLMDVARLAHMRGAGEILLTTRSDNQAILPMVLAAGLRGRIRMAADVLTVRVPVHDLKPLAS